MKNRKNILKLRLVNTLIFIALLFIQYNGVFTISISRASPMLPLALLVTICMFCSELTAAISGLIVGVFIDNNIFASVALCALCTAFYLLLRWAFCIAFSANFSENLTYIMRTIFPSVLYTAVFSIPFYYLERKLYGKFYK